MAWTDIARREHNRDSARYPSDLMDREWALIAPLLPPAKRGGRPRTTCLRAVFDAILYIDFCTSIRAALRDTHCATLAAGQYRGMCVMSSTAQPRLLNDLPY